jgi:hypothetical protein
MTPHTLFAIIIGSERDSLSFVVYQTSTITNGDRVFFKPFVPMLAPSLAAGSCTSLVT